MTRLESLKRETFPTVILDLDYELDEFPHDHVTFQKRILDLEHDVYTAEEMTNKTFSRDHVTLNQYVVSM